MASRMPGWRVEASSLSKTQNVARLTPKISCSVSVISLLEAAFRIGTSSAAPRAAADTPLTNDNDNPATPKTGKVLRLRFRFEVRLACDMAVSPDFGN